MSGQKKGKKVSPYFVRKYVLYTIIIKLNSKSHHIYTTGFSTEFEVNLKGRPFFLEKNTILGEKLEKMEMKLK